MRICVHKTTGKIIEAQSHATEGTLLANAIAAGLNGANYEERVVTHEEYLSLVNAQINWIEFKTKEIKAEAQRRILTKLPGATPENYRDKELNYLARHAELNAIVLGAYRDAIGTLQPARALTASEVTEIAAISAFWDWVKANRKASNEVEADLQASTDKANFNVVGSARWPA